MKPLFPGRRFSFLRLFIAILCIALVAAGTWSWITFTRTAAKKLPEPWFGGYVDVTATPSYEFESKVGNVYRNVILGFVTAGDGCQPSWGGYYTLDEAASTLDLDSRIAQTYKTDRTVTVSFGGQNGTELASACTDVDALADAYQQVIDRYHVTSLDFDIENTNLDGYSETATRRAQAVAKLIANEKAKNKGKDDTSHDLTISLTLPADAKGLTTQGMQTVNAFLDAGVTLSTVNLMTMDFNVASTSITQSTLIKSSLNAAHAQYKTLLYSRGKLFSDHQIWELLGATVLIGQNDTKNEYFTLDNAREINTFALETSLGHLSMWSLNRDQQCGENYTNTNTLKTFCSGMKQTDGEFATTLGSGFRGTPGTLVDFDNARWNSSQQAYPTWEPDVLYKQGDKVIWNGNIYESLGNNENKQPDSAEEGPNAPWRIIGTGAIGKQTHRQALFPNKSSANRETVKQGNEIRQSWHRSNRNIRQPPAASQKMASESRSDSPFWPLFTRCFSQPQSHSMHRKACSDLWKAPRASAYGRCVFCCAWSTTKSVRRIALPPNTPCCRR